MATEKSLATKAGLGNRIDPRRLDFVERLYLGDDTQPPLPTRTIERRTAEEYGISKRQARNYIAVVRKRLREGFVAEDQDAVRARAESMLLESFTMAKSTRRAGDMTLAAQRLAELHGAFTRKVEIDAKVTGLADMLAAIPEDD